LQDVTGGTWVNDSHQESNDGTWFAHSNKIFGTLDSHYNVDPSSITKSLFSAYMQFVKLHAGEDLVPVSPGPLPNGPIFASGVPPVVGFPLYLAVFSIVDLTKSHIIGADT
jgi:hypothetical protein